MPTSDQIVSRKVVAAAGAFLLAAFPVAVIGQGLPTLPGLTALQQPTAVNIQDTCVEITAGQGVAPNPNGTAIQRLANSCSLMVSTAFYLQGQVPPFDPDGNFDLRISNQRLRAGVQAISPVQMNAQKQMSTEAAKLNQIGARLLDLRDGSRGFVANMNGAQPALATLTPAKALGLDGATGGGAAADTLGGGPWGGFMNVAYSWGNVDQTDLQNAYKYDSFSVLAGADYRVSDSLVIGGAISYSDTHSDYDQGLGNVKAQTTGVIGYVTWYKDKWFVDGFLSYGHVSYDSTRVIFIPSNNPVAPAINGTATASPKGDQWSASIGVGANYPMGSVTVTPSLRLGGIWVENDAFTEDEPVAGLGLAVQSRRVRSVQTRAGREGQHQPEHGGRRVRALLLWRVDARVRERQPVDHFPVRERSDERVLRDPHRQSHPRLCSADRGLQRDVREQFLGILPAQCRGRAQRRDELRRGARDTQAVLT